MCVQVIYVPLEVVAHADDISLTGYPTSKQLLTG